MTEDFGKFKATIESNCCLAKRHREVDLEVIWVSCGVYQITYRRPKDAENPEVIVAKDWYPKNINISFTPEQFEKAFELFADAPKQERPDCYKPYYEDYDLDRGMFDFENDTLFQAYKDPNPSPDINRVCLVNRHYGFGRPTKDSGLLELSFEDFKRLKEFLDEKKDLIFYSGCKISFPSKIMSDLQSGVAAEIEKVEQVK